MNKLLKLSCLAIVFALSLLCTAYSKEKPCNHCISDTSGATFTVTKSKDFPNGAFNVAVTCVIKYQHLDLPKSTEPYNKIFSNISAKSKAEAKAKAVELLRSYAEGELKKQCEKQKCEKH